MQKSNPILDNLVIQDNIAVGYTYGGGGGVYFKTSGSTIKNSVLRNNDAFSQYGGGIYSQQAYVNIISCEIYNNTANWGGGGIATDIVLEQILLIHALLKQYLLYWWWNIYTRKHK